MTWTTVFLFSEVAGNFVSTTSTGQATELPAACPMCCEESSVKDDAAGHEADHLHLVGFLNTILYLKLRVCYIVSN
jgi:hypothetical protein